MLVIINPKPLEDMGLIVPVPPTCAQEKVQSLLLVSHLYSIN